MNYYDLPSMGKWSRMVFIWSFDNKIKSVTEQNINVFIDNRDKLTIEEN